MSNYLQKLKGKNMAKKKIVIIGGGVAGFNTALNIINKTSDFEVIIIKKEKHPTCSACGMPFVLEGKISKMENILLKKLEDSVRKKIKIMAGYEVTKIDLENKKLEIKNHEPIDYDKLVIATGRKSFIPKINGTDLKGVFTLSNYQDGLKLLNYLTNAKRAVVIGAGPIGLECASAFAENKIKTTIIEILPQILPKQLDFDIAEILEKRLKGIGIEIFTSTKVSSINGNGKVESVTTIANKNFELQNNISVREIKADLVLISTGIKPNSDLARNSGIEIGKTNGIIIDSSNHVKKDGRFLYDVFAIGDCVEVLNPLTNQKYLSALASTSVLQSKVIAENIIGREMNVKGYLSPLISVISGFTVGSVGLTKNFAEKNGINLKSCKVKSITRARYYPGAKEILIKLHVCNEKIVGCQIISNEDVKERINFITYLINNKVCIKEVIKMERCYTPPLTLLNDPFIKAVEEVLKK